MAEGKEASVSDASAEEKALLLLKAAELGRADIINETCATLTEGGGALFHAHVTHVTPGCRKSLTSPPSSRMHACFPAFPQTCSAVGLRTTRTAPHPST